MLSTICLLHHLAPGSSSSCPPWTLWKTVLPRELPTLQSRGGHGNGRNTWLAFPRKSNPQLAVQFPLGKNARCLHLPFLHLGMQLCVRDITTVWIYISQETCPHPNLFIFPVEQGFGTLLLNFFDDSMERSAVLGEVFRSGLSLPSPS